MLGDATEIYVLEKAGIRRPPDLVLALTGDDEDNMVICQLAKEKYGVPKVIARVNDPRNQPHFDLLGISPTVSATSNILALVEHEVPEHELIHLLELRKENLEIVEVQIDKDSPSAGKEIERLGLPEGAQLISVMRNGQAQIAIGAKSGKTRWRFTPSGYASWAGSYQITNSSPVADPSRRFVYAAAPNGRIYKLDARTGHAIWSVAITLLPSREKLGTALNYSRGLVLATTGGFIGDTPPYQGHVAAIGAASGRLVHVWNALCSNRAGLIRPSSCPESGAAIWARSGAVVDPATGIPRDEPCRRRRLVVRLRPGLRAAAGSSTRNRRGSGATAGRSGPLEQPDRRRRDGRTPRGRRECTREERRPERLAPALSERLG